MYQFSLSPYFSIPCENQDFFVLYIDEVILQRTGATDNYFTHDYRYSVTSLTNASGNIVESYDYKVYGERTTSGAGLTDVGYTGQRHDSETGLMYFKNRYYSTSMGQFVTRDPLGFVDGLSMYLGYFGGDGADALGLDDAFETNFPPSEFWSTHWSVVDIYKVDSDDGKSKVSFARKYYDAVMKFKLYSNLQDWQECDDNQWFSDKLFGDAKNKVKVQLGNLETMEILNFIKGNVGGFEKFDYKPGSPRLTINIIPTADMEKGNSGANVPGSRITMDVSAGLTNRQVGLLALHESVESNLGGAGSAHAQATRVELQSAASAGVSTNFIRWRMLNLIKSTGNSKKGNADHTTNSFLVNKHVRDEMQAIMDWMAKYTPIECKNHCKSDEQKRRDKNFNSKGKYVFPENEIE